MVRTIEIKQNQINYQSVLDEFENSKLETIGSLTTFEGTKSLNLSDFESLDNVNKENVQTQESVNVQYFFSYDKETNMVTLSAETKDANNIIQIEQIQGYAFLDENNNIDALLEVDGEYILLSEMQDVGLIQNCGLFSNLFRKIAVAVVAVVAVSAVVACVVATCGAGLGAVIAAGAIAGAVTGGVAGGVISYTEYGALDWKWVVGGALIGGALGAMTGWGIGTALGVGTTGSTSQVNSLINLAKNGKMDFSNSIKNKTYFKPGSSDYRSYYEQVNLLSQEIMQAKNPIIESGTNYFKWTVEGAKNSTKGVWELVIDPVRKVIVHFLFRT